MIGTRKNQASGLFSGQQESSYGFGELEPTLKNAHADGIVMDFWSADGVAIDTLYMDRKVVYDKTGTAVDLPPLIPAQGTRAFAEMPELVFVSGYPKNVSLNQYFLDTSNLYPTKTHPWDGDNGYVSDYNPALIIDSGSLPVGLIFNSASNELVYTGEALTGENVILDCRFYHDNIYSDYFQIKLLHPTLEWSYTESGIPLHDAVVDAVASNTRTENVFVVRAGEWTNEDLKIGGGNYLNCFAGLDNMYLVGDGSMPIISGGNTDWTANNGYPIYSDGSYQSRCMLYCNETKHIYVYGIDFRFTEMASKNCEYGVYDNVIMRLHPGGADFWIYAFIDEQTKDPKFFLSNVLTYHIGDAQTKHPIYGEAVDRYSDVPSGFVGSSFLNNYTAYEARGPGRNYGGHTYKDICDNVNIRNSWFSLSKDPDNPDEERIGNRPLLSLHSTQRAVLFNNDLHSYYDTTRAGYKQGSPTTILFQCRNLPSAIGMYKPGYFSSPSMRTNTLNEREKQGYECWENWAGDDEYSGPWTSTKNTEFHGENANRNYSLTGALGDEEPNPTPPVDAPFWDTIGDVSVLSNDNAFGKYLSYNRFHNIPTENPNSLQNAIKSQTSAPTSFPYALASKRDFLPVPSNWKERTWIHSCNNSFDEYPKPYVYGEIIERNINYAYSVDEVAAVKDNYTNHGGDIVDGAGSQVNIPEDFKL